MKKVFFNRFFVKKIKLFLIMIFSFCFSDTSRLTTTSDETNNNSSELDPRHKRAKLKRKTSKAYFLTEADQSGSSDDEEEDNNYENRYDLADSFLDEERQYTQNASIYLQMQHQQPEPNLKPWMNRQLKPITDDIFSQVPEPDDSYAVDSFLVSDSYMTQKPAKKPRRRGKKSKYDVDSDDLELIEEAAAAMGGMDELPCKKKKSKKVESSSDEERMAAKASKFKRVKVLSESSAEDAAETTDTSSNYFVSL